MRSMKYKVCRGCGTRVPMSKDKCPVCGTTDFTIVDEPEEKNQTLDWAPDGNENTTKLFPLTGNHRTVQREREDDTEQEPVRKQPRKKTQKKKTESQKKKTESRKESKKSEHAGVNLEHLLKRFPPMTRLLIMILSALVVIVLVVSIVAVASRKQTKTAAASTPTASATASASAQAASETARADGQPIGKAVITADTIKIRTEPNTDAGVLGIVQKDDQYDVYETKTDGSYTWYCIGSEKWIADDGGEWVTYTAGD